MKVVLYQFGKKINSTIRPQGEGIEVNVSLKDGCSIINPVLDFATFRNPSLYNYAYIEDFGRYYYIRNWTSERNRWIAEMVVDILASFRTDIGESSQFIGRAQNADSEAAAEIVDSLYPITAKMEHEVTTLGVSVQGAVTAGTYILGVANRVYSYVGATYYATDVEGINQFKSWFTNSLNNLSKELFNPSDYVISCRWYPFNRSQLGIGESSKTNQVVLGPDYIQDVSSYNFYELRLPTRSFSFSITAPTHPQASLRWARYLNTEPYTQRVIYFPGFGTFSLSASDVKAGNYKIGGFLEVDVTSGTAVLTVHCGEDQVVSNVFSANVSASVPIMSEDLQLGSIVSNALSYNAGANSAGGGSPAAGGAADTGIPGQLAIPGSVPKWYTAAQTAASGLAPVASGVASAVVGSLAISALTHGTAITTGGGTYAYGNTDAVLISTFYYIADEDTMLGRPLMQTRVVSSLPGFLQIPTPRFIIAGMTDAELSALNTVAISGFFYE